MLGVRRGAVLLDAHVRSGRAACARRPGACRAAPCPGNPAVPSGRAARFAGVAAPRRPTARAARRRPRSAPATVPVCRRRPRRRSSRRSRLSRSASLRPSSSASVWTASWKMRTRSDAWSGVERTSIRTGKRAREGHPPSSSMSAPSSSSNSLAKSSCNRPSAPDDSCALRRAAAIASVADAAARVVADRLRGREARALRGEVCRAGGDLRGERVALCRRRLASAARMRSRSAISFVAPATIFLPANAARAGSWKSRYATWALEAPHCECSTGGFEARPSKPISVCSAAFEEPSRLAAPKSSQMRLSRVEPALARGVEAEARFGRILGEREPPRLARCVDREPWSSAKPTSSTFGGRWTWKSVRTGDVLLPRKVVRRVASRRSPRRPGGPRARRRRDSGGRDRRGRGTRAGRRALGSTWVPSAPAAPRRLVQVGDELGLPGPERVEIGAALVGRVLAPEQLAAHLVVEARRGRPR